MSLLILGVRPEFGKHQDQRGIQKSPLFEIRKQHAQHVIEVRHEFAMAFKVVVMAVPKAPCDFHHRHARFQEPAGQQGLFAELGPPVFTRTAAGSRSRSNS